MNEIFKPIKMILLYILLSIIFALPNHILKIETGILYNALSILENMCVLGIILYIMRDGLKEKLKLLKQNVKDNYKKYIKYYLIGMLLMALSNLIIVTFITKSIATNEQSNRELFFANPFSTFIIMVIIDPLIEELIFRHSFKDLFKKKYLFIFMTSLLFASMHIVFSFTTLKDLFFIIPYFSLGAIFGFTYYESDNVFVSALIHSMHNAICLLLLL